MKEQAHVAVVFQYAESDLAEMLHALLAQLHEELVRRDVHAVEAAQFVDAVANDGDGFAFQPHAEPRAAAHQKHVRRYSASSVANTAATGSSGTSS